MNAGNGIEAEVSGAIAGLGAKLDLSIGSIDKLGNRLERQLKKIPAQPVFGRVRGTAIADSSGFALIRFDQPGPTQGFFWYVRSLSIGGLSPSVTAAGSADVYVIAGQPPAQADDLLSLGLSDWRDRATTLPSPAFYGSGELVLRMNENLYVIVTGGTNLQQYVAAASIEIYEEAAIRQAWAL